MPPGENRYTCNVELTMSVSYSTDGHLVNDLLMNITNLIGLTFGTLVGLPLSGFLCGISWDNGWPLAFYVPGALAVVWFFFWIVLVFEDPDVHPRISPEEKQYIKSSTGRSVDNDQKKVKVKHFFIKSFNDFEIYMILFCIIDIFKEYQ